MVVDRVAPDVPSVSHFYNQSVFTGLGRKVFYTVYFDKPVKVTGTPQLAVEIGSQQRRLDYVGSGHPDRITPDPTLVATSTNFQYTVVVGSPAPR